MVNLARKNAFPEDAWKQGKTSITFANQDKEGSGSYCVAPVRLSTEESPTNIVFVQYEVEDYDGILGSNAIREWEPFTIDKEFLLFKDSYQLPRVYQPLSFTHMQPKEGRKKRKNVSHAYLIKQFEKNETYLADIKREFEESIMTKDLSKHQRRITCDLILKRDVNGEEMLPKCKANYFLMSAAETEVCAKEISSLLEQKGYPLFGFLQPRYFVLANQKLLRTSFEHDRTTF